MPTLNHSTLNSKGIKRRKVTTDIKQNEYQVALKGESWKMALIVAIDRALDEVANLDYSNLDSQSCCNNRRDEFISLMNQMGYCVNWTDNRKYITYTTSDGKRCRDNKLHDQKYLKEVMEYEFSKVEEYRIGEAGYTDTAITEHPTTERAKISTAEYHAIAFLRTHNRIKQQSLNSKWKS